MRSSLLLPVLAFCLAACGDSAPEYTAAGDGAKNNRVHQVQYEHVVQFADNNATLAPDEAARLSQFLSRHGGNGGAVMSVGHATSSALARNRERTVREMLATRGYRQVDVVYTGAQSTTFNQVVVAVSSAVVKTPRCPDYSKPTEYNYGNTPHSNYSCANTHNLGVMVADPADLARGRDQGAQDGDSSVLAVQRYRTGKTTPLKEGDSKPDSGTK